ncbi:hypothetical protein WJX74_008015 [Apatococcus lobatus]|uniref:Uncharacterized protein n=1 Tax=Apatococcus lobatus TaxID=904363 RepID=A0AAW1RD26_9CHLO
MPAQKPQAAPRAGTMTATSASPSAGGKPIQDSLAAQVPKQTAVAAPAAGSETCTAPAKSPSTVPKSSSAQKVPAAPSSAPPPSTHPMAGSIPAAGPLAIMDTILTAPAAGRVSTNVELQGALHSTRALCMSTKAAHAEPAPATMQKRNSASPVRHIGVSDADCKHAAAASGAKKPSLAPIPLHSPEALAPEPSIPTAAQAKDAPAPRGTVIAASCVGSLCPAVPAAATVTAAASEPVGTSSKRARAVPAGTGMPPPPARSKPLSLTSSASPSTPLSASTAAKAPASGLLPSAGLYATAVPHGTCMQPPLAEVVPCLPTSSTRPGSAASAPAAPRAAAPEPCGNMGMVPRAKASHAGTCMLPAPAGVAPSSPTAAAASNYPASVPSTQETVTATPDGTTMRPPSAMMPSDLPDVTSSAGPDPSQAADAAAACSACSRPPPAAFPEILFDPVPSASHASAEPADTAAQCAVQQMNPAGTTPLPANAATAELLNASFSMSLSHTTAPQAPHQLSIASRDVQLAILQQAGPAQAAARSVDSVLGKRESPPGIQPQPKRNRNEALGLSKPPLVIVTANEHEQQCRSLLSNTTSVPGPLHSLRAKSGAVKDIASLRPPHQFLNMLPANQGFQPVGLFSLNSWEQLTDLP